MWNQTGSFQENGTAGHNASVSGVNGTINGTEGDKAMNTDKGSPSGALLRAGTPWLLAALLPVVGMLL